VKTKNMTAACAIFGLAMSFAGMSYAEGDGGGEEECRCEEPTKGNNGWGNGLDGVNPGTSKGGTADTKENQPGIDPEKETRFGGR
jgi:hypothetical protein